MATRSRILCGLAAWAASAALAASTVWADSAPAVRKATASRPAGESRKVDRQNKARLAADDGQEPPGMVLIPAGSFQMGNTLRATGDGPSKELPVHTVHLDTFHMDRHEVTKGLWDTVRTWATANGYDLHNVGAGKAVDHPVHRVSWYDCVKWSNARSQKEGRTPCYYTDSKLTTVYKTGESAPFVKWVADGYRLPTEAEWEKAARGGVAGHRFPWSDTDTIQHERANYYSAIGFWYNTSPTYGYHPTFAVGGFPYTSPVGSFAPNGYGLHDMAGNVWEWCHDWYSSTYYSSSPTNNPHGPTNGTFRILRGCGWDFDANSCRVAFRNSYTAPNVRANYHGLRCAAAAP